MHLTFSNFSRNISVTQEITVKSCLKLSLPVLIQDSYINCNIKYNLVNLIPGGKITICGNILWGQNPWSLK